MPAIASDRLVDLHNDLTYYDLTIAQEMREFLRGRPINRRRAKVDTELEDNLRTFKTRSPPRWSVAGELLRYKRRIDDVVRALLVLDTQRNQV